MDQVQTARGATAEKPSGVGEASSLYLLAKKQSRDASQEVKIHCYTIGNSVTFYVDFLSK